MAKGLMTNKVDKSYMIICWSNLLLIVVKGNFQVKYWNAMYFPSMRCIQTEQGSRRWLASLHLCLESLRGYKKQIKISQPRISQPRT